MWSPPRSPTCGAPTEQPACKPQFPADLYLPHGLIDVQEPEPNVAVVCPKLLELIDRLTAL